MRKYAGGQSNNRLTAAAATPQAQESQSGYVNGTGIYTFEDSTALVGLGLIRHNYFAVSEAKVHAFECICLIAWALGLGAGIWGVFCFKGNF